MQKSTDTIFVVSKWCPTLQYHIIQRYKDICDFMRKTAILSRFRGIDKHLWGVIKIFSSIKSIKN